MDSLNKSLNIEYVEKSESISKNKDKLLGSWSKLPLEHLFDIYLSFVLFANHSVQVLQSSFSKKKKKRVLFKSSTLQIQLLIFYQSCYKPKSNGISCFHKVILYSWQHDNIMP